METTKGKSRVQGNCIRSRRGVATASQVLSGNNRVAPDIQKVVFEEATKLGTPQRPEARTFYDHPWWNEDAESSPAICAS
jgi:hypothetical protein